MNGNQTRGKLTDKFADLIELKWSDFLLHEKNPDIDNLTYLVIVLIRACVKGDMRAIKESLDRMDGKVATEVEVEYPRFYILYPNATATLSAPHPDAPPTLHTEMVVEANPVISSPSDSILPASLDYEEDETLPTGSLRIVLSRMLEAKVSIVKAILTAVERRDVGMPDGMSDPYVKSAMVAGLIKLVHNGRVNAVIEILDQIDGKVKERIKVLGGDIYIKNYAQFAPPDATRNLDGVYQISSPIVTDVWAARLDKGNKR